MYKALRIVFSILAAAAAAAAIFVFVFVGWVWGLVTVAVCIAFGVAMFLCKRAQERKELKENPPAPIGDFITGPVKSDDTEEK